MNTTSAFPNFGSEFLKSSYTNKRPLRHIQSTRTLNQGQFYKDKLTVINEEEAVFPGNVLTLFDNTGNVYDFEIMSN